MPSTAQLIKIRQSRLARQHHTLWGRLGIIGVLVASLVMLALLALLVTTYFILTKDLPPVNSLYALLEPPRGSLLQPSRLYDRTQTQVLMTLENPAAEGRMYLRIGGQLSSNQFSPNLIAATITALDPGFWGEPGYSLKGITTGMHPTIAQRLVSGLLLENEPGSLQRNIQERLLAMQVTAEYGREKVLEWYLNSVSYGEFVNGADAASRVYLGKPATQLSVAEAALLTVISEMPGINPWNEWLQIRDRQVQLIQAMLVNGLISPGEVDMALRENIQLRPQQLIQSIAPEFTNLVLSQLSSQGSLDRIYRGGYQIITTLDYTLQSQVVCATRQELERLDAGLHMTNAADLQCENVSQIPLQEPGSASQKLGVDASVLVLDPQLGQILVWVGGADMDPIPSPPSAHPARTVLSPFWYLTGFSRGLSPATMLWDLPLAHSRGMGAEDISTYHGPVRSRLAMVNDYLGAAADLVQQVGVDAIQQTMQKFGLSYQPSDASALENLYIQPVSLLEATQAYGILANQGVMAGQNLYHQGQLQATGILLVEAIGGQAALDWTDAQVQPIVSSQLAYLVTNVLSDSNARASSLEQSMEMNRPAALKVSIDSQANNTWAVGYIPQLAVGVWMAAPHGELTSEQGATLWQTVMEYSASKLPAIDFAEPGGMSRVQVCDPSGLLVSATCPLAVDEVFLQGSEPTRQDNLYKDYFIDTNTGLQATVFTPPRLVERQVFLSVPPEATDWAVASGVPLSPEQHDEVITPAYSIEESSLSQPEVSADVRGRVEVRGRASMEDFSYYRLQVGEGVYPQEWLQVGPDVHQPVQDGLLGSWDTSGLDGPYVIELLVVSQDQRFERVFSLVNVDNTPPLVQIQAPAEGAIVDVEDGRPVILQVDASDNQAIKKLEYYIDGTLIASLYEPPFVVIWPAKQGEHKFLINAFDTAGNEGVFERKFLVNR